MSLYNSSAQNAEIVDEMENLEIHPHTGIGCQTTSVAASPTSYIDLDDIDAFDFEKFIELDTSGIVTNEEVNMLSNNLSSTTLYWLSKIAAQEQFDIEWFLREAIIKKFSIHEIRLLDGIIKAFLHHQELTFLQLKLFISAIKDNLSDSPGPAHDNLLLMTISEYGSSTSDTSTCFLEVPSITSGKIITVSGPDQLKLLIENDEELKNQLTPEKLHELRKVARNHYKQVLRATNFNISTKILMETMLTNYIKSFLNLKIRMEFLFSRSIYGTLYVSNLRQFLVTNHLQIIGVPIPNAWRFRIDMFTEDGEVLFHFNPRFDQRCIVRNSTTNNLWNYALEERAGSEFPFESGKQFVLNFIKEHNSILCFVNHNKYCKFEARSDLNRVDRLEIYGDAQIQHVSFKNKTS